jgi:ketosteroid isomerase-like protein
MTSLAFDTPTAAEAAFYGAFAATDATGMERVWGQDGPILCVHPGGALLAGRKAVLQSWIEIFAGAQSPGVEYRLLESFSDGGLAIHLVEERIRPSTSSRGEPTRVLATNTYRRADDGWRIVAHHASLPLMPPRGTGTPQAGPRVH